MVWYLGLVPGSGTWVWYLGLGEDLGLLTLLQAGSKVGHDVLLRPDHLHNLLVALHSHGLEGRRREVSRGTRTGKIKKEVRKERGEGILSRGRTENPMCGEREGLSGRAGRRWMGRCREGER